MTEAFSWIVRVYYEDTDAGGIVYYANYLKYFERARTEWLRAAGIGQKQAAASDGVLFVVKTAMVDFHAPACMDDELKLHVRVEKLGRASIQFLQQIWRGPELLTTGRFKVGCVDSQTLRPNAIPATILVKITTME
ncbi:MAG: tol-pal system-associated acyl-CoA thioesterase [Pseudomonadota bacterium]